MAEEFQFSFSMKQIEALIKALERCGINSGNYSSALEYFNDPELINAGKAAHGVLRSKGQRQARSHGGSEVLGELSKDTAIGDLRNTYRGLRGEYIDMLSHITELLTTVRTVRSALQGKLAQLQESERAAVHHLDDMLSRIAFSDSDLAQKLRALENDATG
jgi:HEPN domain-containing protein